MALRRQVKNVVKNFTDIEVKVREATSNDPWGPSSSLTSEIADATYNVQDFTEIMTLLWKRINDHGKNWRHVYKSLVVLDYIVKTGSERVAQQCRENIFAIKTLKDFQFIDKDGKDQGINVREKSKQLVGLLKDDERLKNERQRALKAKERFSQSEGGIGNTSFPKNKKFQGNMKYTESGGSVDDSNLPSRTFKEPERSEDSRSTDGRIDSDIEKVRPSNEAEEEMQLQIALAMSREEAEKDERTSQNDSQRLNMAVQESQQQVATSTLLNLTNPTPTVPKTNTNMFDSWGDPPEATRHQSTIKQSQPQPLADPWSSSVQSNNMSIYAQPIVSNTNQQLADPWGAPEPKAADPWGASAPVVTPQPDPWGSPSQLTSVLKDPFAPENSTQSLPAYTGNLNLVSQSNANQGINFSSDETSATPLQPSTSTATKSSSFLSNGAHLVDVDNILATPSSNKTNTNVNPFVMGSVAPSNTNPFLQDKPKPKSINEIRNDKFGFAVSGPGGDILLPAPMAPTNQQQQQQSHNPFM